MSQTISQSDSQLDPELEKKTEQQIKLARANIRIAIFLGIIALAALFSTFYFFYNSKLPT